MPSSSLAPTALAASLEKAINFALQYDPATHLRLAKLEGSVLALHCSEPDLNLYFSPGTEKCRVSAEHADKADIEISGKGRDLFALLFNGNHSLANTPVSASGKIALLNEYQQIFAALDIDWEAVLNERLGNVAGHQVAELIRAAANYGKYSAQHIKSALPEVMSEELRLTPPPAEFTAFSEEISELRRGADRLSARAQKLINAIKQKHETDQNA